MDLQQRLDILEQRLGKTDSLVISLREACDVSGWLEARHEKAMKDHEIWLQNHDEAMNRLEKAQMRLEKAQKRESRELKRLRQQGQETDRRIAEMAAQNRAGNEALEQRIAGLVSAIGEFIRRQP